MSNTYLITGGAGFIGINYVYRLLSRGDTVKIYDNLSRRGGISNLLWIEEVFGKNAVELIVGDIRDKDKLREAVRDVDIIAHLAAQVAVTTSVINPREDFEINALGTLNVLEAARESGKQPVVLYASTNKVYGGMEDTGIIEEGDHYRYAELKNGVPETQPLDFHSPYGCSKGTGDQYVRDYARIYGLPTVVFRQSCIYGPRQFGIEDQGFLAWFVIAAILKKPITIFGDGKQVRDILYVDDLLSAYDLAVENIERVKGEVYNVGGGPDNTLAIWRQFAPLLEELLGGEVPIESAEWRPGDQLVYVSDIRKAFNEFGWKPEINTEEGIRKLFYWVKSNRHLFD